MATTAKKNAPVKSVKKEKTELQNQVGKIVYAMHEDKIIKCKVLSYRLHGDSENEQLNFICNQVGTTVDFKINSNGVFPSIPALFSGLKKAFEQSQQENKLSA